MISTVCLVSVLSMEESVVRKATLRRSPMLLSPYSSIFAIKLVLKLPRGDRLTEKKLGR